jgi:hypothetical protein
MRKSTLLWKAAIALALIAIAIVPFGCTTGGGTTTTTPAGTTGAQGPTLNITAPAFDFDPAHPGERPLVSGPANITITVETTGFNIVPAGQSGQAPAGHLVYYMDVIPPVTAGQSALTQAGTYVATTSKTQTWQNVTPGPHVFWVMLVNTDNTPLLSPVLDSRDVFVLGPQGTVPPTATPGAAVSITAPAFNFDPAHPGELPLIKGPNITITVNVTGFNLVAAGQTGQAPFGHLVYYMDVLPPTTTGQSAHTQTGTFVATTATSNTWTNVTPGPHTFWVQLVNTNNTPLTPPEVAQISLLVEP